MVVFSAVLNLYSRRIVGYATSTNPDNELTKRHYVWHLKLESSLSVFYSTAIKVVITTAALIVTTLALWYEAKFKSSW